MVVLRTCTSLFLSSEILYSSVQVKPQSLGYRLRSRKRVLLQGSRGLTSTPSRPFPIIHVIHVPELLYMFLTALRRSWFSARGLGRGPEMHGTHLKHRQCLQPINFNNLKLLLTHVIGVVWDASIACGNWCSPT